MNKAILMGRLTKDPELKTTGNNNAVCTFNLAVDRRFKSQNGERQTDFIPIVAWRQTAEFVNRYFRQGSKIVLVGSIQVRSWDDNQGNRRWTTEVIADEVYFAESKAASGHGSEQGYQSAQGNNSNYQTTQNNLDYFESPPDDIGLPFDL